MKELKIHFLNTIWSDVILLESNNHYSFIDTGSLFYYPMIDKHLKDYNISNIDFIILTHFHSDHYGNIVNIVNDYKVNKLYMKHYHGLDGSTASGYSSNEEYIEHEFSKYNEIIDACNKNNTEIIYIDEFNKNVLDIDFNGVNLECYDCNNRLYELYSNPNSPFYNQKKFNENYNSLGVFIKHNNYNIFLGGDASCTKSDTEDINVLSIKMINKIYEKHNINHIDIYKSCHHGGSGTNTKELCDLLKTKYAIITNTDRWLDNYSTIPNLKESNNNVVVLKTDHQKYIFNISKDISYEEIKDESLFILLNKN